MHTKPIANLNPMTPVIRDLDGYIYFRENNGRLLAGGFEPVAKPAFEDGMIPGQIYRCKFVFVTLLIKTCQGAIFYLICRN